jgi:hypothetical protein
VFQVHREQNKAKRMLEERMKITTLEERLKVTVHLPLENSPGYISLT